MMTLNRTYKLALMTLGIVAITFLAMCMVNEMKRKNIIDHNKDVLASLAAEIDAYKNLGFSEDDMVMQVTKSRMSYVQKELNTIKAKRRVIFKENALKSVKTERLQELLHLNKTMADNYRHEIQEYMNLGLPDTHHALETAKNNLARLVLEIAELEHTLKVESKQSHIVAYNEKMYRIIEVNKQSLDLCKQEMKEYLQLGLSQKDERVKNVRARITKKASEIADLERQV